MAAGNNSDIDEYMRLYDYDITSPQAILRNIRTQVIDLCSARVDRVLHQNYFLNDQEIGELWNRSSALAVKEFDEKSKAFGSTRDDEFKELITTLETRKAHYIVKNTDKKCEHQQVLQNEAKDLFQTYKEMMNELRQDEDPESKLIRQHEFWFTKLTTEYAEAFGDSPLFNPDLLSSLIMSEYPRLKHEINQRGIKNKTTGIVKSALQIYDQEIIQVKAEEDFESAHEEAVKLVEKTLPYDKNLVKSINIRGILAESKERVARGKVLKRIKETKDKIQSAKTIALAKYYEVMGPQVSSQIPVLEAVLDSRHHNGRAEALDLFSFEFDSLRNSVKNPDETKQKLTHEIDRVIQSDYIKRNSKNLELWDQYKFNLEAATIKCNQYYISESAKLSLIDEAGKKRLLKEVKKMFKEAAKPRIFEPKCIQEARKKIEAFQDEESLDEFEVLNESFYDYGYKVSDSEASTASISDDQVKGKSSSSGDCFLTMHFDFLVKLENGKLVLQEDVLRKCLKTTEAIGASRMVFVGHAGQRNSGKTSVANEVITYLQSQDLVKSSSDSGTFQDVQFPSEDEKLNLKSNGLLVVLRPVVATYGGMTAAVFVLDLAENGATEQEYTALVDFTFLVSTATIFSARPSQFEVTAWNPDSSVVPRFFGPKTLDKLCVLLQAPLNGDPGFIDQDAAVEVSDDCQMNSVKAVATFGPYFRRVSYYAIPARGNSTEMKEFVSSALTSQNLLSGFYALHQTASCEATLKERAQQINCLTNLPQAHR